MGLDFLERDAEGELKSNVFQPDIWATNAESEKLDQFYQKSNIKKDKSSAHHIPANFGEVIISGNIIYLLFHFQRK